MSEKVGARALCVEKRERLLTTPFCYQGQGHFAHALTVHLCTTHEARLLTSKQRTLSTVIVHIMSWPVLVTNSLNHQLIRVALHVQRHASFDNKCNIIGGRSQKFSARLVLLRALRIMVDDISCFREHILHLHNLRTYDIVFYSYLHLGMLPWRHATPELQDLYIAIKTFWPSGDRTIPGSLIKLADFLNLMELCPGLAYNRPNITELLILCWLWLNETTC